MKHIGTILVIAGIFLLPLHSHAVDHSLVISEFMAINETTFTDEDNDYPDWIELCNTGTGTVSLAGYYLTDSLDSPDKWQFPPTNIPPRGYLVVFASDKNRAISGEELHANFKLKGTGEFLALTAPDGQTFVHKYDPMYPPQITDISYGISVASLEQVLVPSGAACAAHVPSDDSLGVSWHERTGFDDSGWQRGNTAVGYDQNPDYLPLISNNVETAMYAVNATCYIRIPFVLTDISLFNSLVLKMKYDAGFVAWVNGEEIARANAPYTPTWNSAASADHPDSAAMVFEQFEFPLTTMLMPGTNILAIHSLNRTADSSDSLALPELSALLSQQFSTSDYRYFQVPTPGSMNGTGVTDLGPIIALVQHSPVIPLQNENVLVTAHITDPVDNVSQARLHYRVMFGSETTVDMHDDGLGADSISNDTIYSAFIPAGSATPGDMLRYYITATDTNGNPSRMPLEEEPAEYRGTIVHEPALTNALPVLHWFVENYNAAVEFTGTRCSVFYISNFYDNVFVRLRGHSAAWAGWPKPHFKFDFNPGDHFYYDLFAAPVEEFNLNTTYSDKAYMRQTLAFETYTASGCPSSHSFPLRVECNSDFYSVAVFVEQPDKYFLRRQGLDDDGALYKMFNRVEMYDTRVEKKTRKDEPNDDLQALVEGVSTNNPDRFLYIFDNVSLPVVINYVAGTSIMHDTDHIAKNYYLYRDTEGSGEWLFLPWDKDLTFGRNYVWPGNGVLSDEIWADTDPISHPLFGCYEYRKEDNRWNRLIDAVCSSPRGREMYLCRLRTLMDALMGAPGTPLDESLLNRRVSELYAQMEPDVLLDRAEWGNPYGDYQNFHDAVRLMTNEYLAVRRIHLYQTHSIHNGSFVPDAYTNWNGIAFGTINPVGETGSADEEYFELVNTHAYAVDISGWNVSGAVSYTFQPGVVIPVGDTLYVSPDVRAFRSRPVSPRAGEGRFAQGNYSGHLSCLEPELFLYDSQGSLIGTTNYPGQASPAQQYIRISELMYNPGEPPAGSSLDKQEYEFIELYNTATNPLSLDGICFSDGISWLQQETGIVIESNQYAVIVRNMQAFASLYDTNDIRILGAYSGKFNNGGEQVLFEDARKAAILSFIYNDAWYPSTDGNGYSLVFTDMAAAPSAWNDPAFWRPSYQVDGSPGKPDIIPEPGTGILLVILFWCGINGKRI
jgi:hypothetical protein